MPTNGQGIRESARGRLTITMYDPRVKGKTKHVGTVYYGEPQRTHNWYPTKFKAERAARKMKDAAERQRDLELKGAVKETVGQFATRWPREYTEGRSELTLAHNAERTKALIRDFGDRPLWDGISKVEARAWVMGGIVPPEIREVAKDWHGAKHLPGGDIEVPEHTGNHVVVRAMFNDALKTDLTRINPFATLNVPEKPGRRGDAITVLTLEELALLVQTAHETLGEYGIHYGALIQTAAWTGMRPGELWAMNIDPTPGMNYPDFENGEIKVDWQLRANGSKGRPKWGSRRTVFLLPPAQTALRVAIGDRPGGEMFVTVRGLRMLNWHNTHYWEKVRVAFWKNLPAERRSKTTSDAGGPEPGKIPLDFDFYELRHLFGTQLAEMGMTPPEIANQMGHKDGGQLAMERYIHPRQPAVKRSMHERYAEYERRRAIGE